MNQTSKISGGEAQTNIEAKLPLRPCGHYVLVKPDKFEITTESGIVVATKDQAKREEVARVKGTLVAAGETAWDAFGGDKWAQVGDHVYFKRHVADRYLDEGDIVDGKPQEYFLMADENILGVLED